MSKRKRKLSAAEKAAKARRRQEYKTIIVNGKQKRARRPPTIDGVPVDDFIRANADPIFPASRGPLGGDGSLILALRAAGANPTALNQDGGSPLSLARTIANYDVAQFLADCPGTVRPNKPLQPRSGGLAEGGSGSMGSAARG
jgi:hypothetical protein